MGWEEAWKDKGFDIKKDAAKVCQYIEPLLPRHATILDIGCGQGRNAFFFAKNGHKVDAIDLVDMGMQTFFPEFARNINFIKGDIMKHDWQPNRYDAVLMIRLLQYIPSENLSILFQKIPFTLKTKGYLGLTLTTEGGILENKIYPVDKYKHTLSEIIPHLSENEFNFISKNPTEGISEVPGIGYRRGYDIIAQKL